MRRSGRTSPARACSSSRTSACSPPPTGSSPLSVVYPLARGGAPVLVLLVGVLFLGHGTSWSQVAAVLLIVAGILLVRGFGHADARSVAFGLSIAACIAATR